MLDIESLAIDIANDIYAPLGLDTNAIGCRSFSVGAGGQRVACVVDDVTTLHPQTGQPSEHGRHLVVLSRQTGDTWQPVYHDYLGETGSVHCVMDQAGKRVAHARTVDGVPTLYITTDLVESGWSSSGPALDSTTPVTTVALSGDGSTVAAVSGTGDVSVYSIDPEQKSGYTHLPFDNPDMGTVSRASLSQSGDFVVLSADASTRVFRRDQGSWTAVGATLDGVGPHAYITRDGTRLTGVWQDALRTYTLTDGEWALADTSSLVVGTPDAHLSMLPDGSFAVFKSALCRWDGDSGSWSIGAVVPHGTLLGEHRAIWYDQDAHRLRLGAIRATEPVPPTELTSAVSTIGDSIAAANRDILQSYFDKDGHARMFSFRSNSTGQVHEAPIVLVNPPNTVKLQQCTVTYDGTGAVTQSCTLVADDSALSVIKTALRSLQ